MHRMTESALFKLKPGEHCVVVLAGERRVEAVWYPSLDGFMLRGERAGDIVPSEHVLEWWPVRSTRP
ncbi:hypothetical protein E4K72_06810 [Oxalobacteraceae bacterium OM1]|nr:hypothetical protein E4K72_06810 [Oxalobacteraceae bacterium OM1]